MEGKLSSPITKIEMKQKKKQSLTYVSKVDFLSLVLLLHKNVYNSNSLELGKFSVSVEERSNFHLYRSC